MICLKIPRILLLLLCVLGFTYAFEFARLPSSEERGLELSLEKPASVLSSDSSNCPIEAFTNQTFYFPLLGACWKVDFTENGVLQGDFNNPKCTNSEYVPSGTYSFLDSTSENKAIYDGKGVGYSGIIKAMSSPAVSGFKAELVSRDPETKTFALDFFFESCFVPSQAPSNNPVTHAPVPLRTPSVLPEVQFVGNPCGDEFSDGLCTLCSGDCDRNRDCAGDLICFQRSGGEDVPGCTWGSNSATLKAENDDYCILPTAPTPVSNPAPSPVSAPSVLPEVQFVGNPCGDEFSDGLCTLCSGDCDRNSDCAGDLICFQRSGGEDVPGCTWGSNSATLKAENDDYCILPPTPTPSPPVDFLDSLKYNDNGCNSTAPCTKCEGPCDTNSSCDEGLTCFSRTGKDPVPGCVTGSPGDIGDVAYCHKEPTGVSPTYIPGDLTKYENGLLLSTGLTSTLIAATGNKVTYTGPNGGESSRRFHGAPDGAAVYRITSGSNAGGWIYASNSESRRNGGVGAITFNSNGKVINYEMVLENTVRNCGGGKTYWGTWVTCEENGSSGQVWEVRPELGSSSQRSVPTVIGGTGGNYESFAYDARDRLNPTFYVTNDSGNGALTRFTPNSAVVAAAERSGDYSEVLYNMGTLEWLLLNPGSGSMNDLTGTFSWTSNRPQADDNSNGFYRNSEGIDVRNGLLYFVTKGSKSLYILDLDNYTYVRSSTVSGAFDGQPDQVQRIISLDPTRDMLYFCEEASADNGIHARDTEGNFYTIIDADTLNSETTGLAFSPDNKHMYISYQSEGLIFDITREDGYPFGAQRLDIKYHNS